MKNVLIKRLAKTKDNKPNNEPNNRWNNSNAWRAAPALHASTLERTTQQTKMKTQTVTND